MATIRLIPSTYYLSSTSYLSVANGSNMYANTDNNTYATVTNSRAATTSYYIYLRGFNFSAIPNGAVINSYTVKLKARESGGSTSSSYSPKLAGGTSTFSTASTTALSTTASVHTFTSTASWESISGYGDEFGIRIDCRRASRNTTSYIYIYGAEIEVDYTLPNPCTITTTLNGNGVISPSGTTDTYDGAEFTLTITPTNKNDPVTVSNNGADVTSQVVAHGSGGTGSAVPSNVTTSGVQSGSSYAQYAIGHSAESPSSSGTSSNMYASSSSTGYAAYSFDFSAIPNNATIESIEVRCYGHRESNTISSTYVSKCAIWQDSAAISDEVDFPSTSNSTITLTPETIPTRAQLDDIRVRHYVGYYGGLVLGITFVVTYSTGTGVDHYTYTFTANGDAVVAVTIGSAKSDTIYIKVNGAWVASTKAYKKVNGLWTEHSDLSTLFISGVNYVKGN